LILNQQHSQSFRRECGLFQGSLLSPFLFNIFIDPLAMKLQEESDAIESETNHSDTYEDLFKLPPIQDGVLYKCQMCSFMSTNEKTVKGHINKNRCSQKSPQILATKEKMSKTFPRFLLYADDIEINGKNSTEVQRLLQVIERWCVENHMTPGLKKCQWVGPPEVTQPLYLNQTPLEKVEAYKYLGVPMTYKGIDFTAYMNKQLESLNKRFWYLHSYGQHLPQAHRLYLVKSEVLSSLEYVLPLYGHYLKTKPTDKKELLKLKTKINQIINLARSWAGQVNKKQVLAQHLTNIYDLMDTIEDRGCSLNSRLEKLQNEHSILKIRNLECNIPTEIKEKSLLFKCFESSTLKEFKDEKIKNPRSKLTLKSFMTQKKRQQNAEKSPLVCYTMIPNKNKRSKTDITYRIQNKEIRSNALKWRKNLVGYTTQPSTSRHRNEYVRVKSCKCTHCNVPFSRSHVNTCPLVTQHPAIVKNQWTIFYKNNERLKKQYPHASSYTIVDYLINTFQIKTFKEVFAIITTHLRYEYHESPNDSNTLSSFSSINLSTEDERAIPHNQIFSYGPDAQRDERPRQRISSIEESVRNLHPMQTRARKRQDSQDSRIL
jgi:hypothetical protein